MGLVYNTISLGHMGITKQVHVTICNYTPIVHFTLCAC